MCRGILCSIQSRERSHGSRAVRGNGEGENTSEVGEVGKGHWRLNLLLFEWPDDIVHRVGVCAIGARKEGCREFFGRIKARLEKIALQ